MIGDGGAAWGITAQIRGKRWLQLTAGALTRRSASWRCWSRYVAAAAGTFQYPKVRSTALSRRLRRCASRRRRRLRGPRRAQCRSIRLLCGSADSLCPCASARCVCGWRAGARAGTGEAWRPDHRVIRHHPGRWPARLSTPARHSRPFESGLLRGKADRSFHYVPRCLVAAVRRVNGGGRTSKQGLCAPD